MACRGSNDRVPPAFDPLSGDVLFTRPILLEKLLSLAA